jgi:uncharacterized damage-inducible protein DinB
MIEAAYTTLLDEALEGWAGVREGVIAEVENIPADRLEWRWAEGSRSVGELIEHILESGLLFKELIRPDGDFTRAPYPDLLHEHAGDLPRGRDQESLLALLEETHASVEASIRQVGELQMLQAIRRFDGLPGTRLAWFQHGVAHEYYHGGQLALVARLLGEVPALTQRIQAMSE